MKRVGTIAALSARAHRSKKLIVTRASNTKLNNADLSRDRPAHKSPRYLCPSIPARLLHPLTRPSLIRVQGYKILNKNVHKMVSNSDWNRRAQAAPARRCGRAPILRFARLANHSPDVFYSGKLYSFLHIRLVKYVSPDFTEFNIRWKISGIHNPFKFMQ